MIHARLRLGPEYSPNGHRIVKILGQCNNPPNGRFEVQDISTGEILYPFAETLTLIWWEQLDRTMSNPS